MNIKMMLVSLAALLGGLLSPVYGANIAISGSVADATGKPLAGVTVTAFTNDNAGKPLAQSAAASTKITAVSAEDGTFRLAGTYSPPPPPDARPAPADPAVPSVLGEILQGSVTVVGSKDGLMPVRVLAKDNAAGLKLTLYPVLKGNVTLIGNLLGSAHVLGLGKAAESEKSVFMLAFDGDPGIRAEFDQIMKDYWPEGGSLDGEAARELENQFMSRLKFHLDGAQFEAMWKEVKQHPYVNAVTVTGETHDDPEGKGRRWVAVSKFGSTTFKYPEKMVTPYKPLTMPGKPPLEIKLNGKVSIKCLYVPPGKFYMGCPLYQIPHWEEAPQHMVNLSKGFYMAEAPITYEQYAAITDDTAAGEGKKPDSAAGLSCTMVLSFCKLLSAKTGKTIRRPTAAEWEYAARVGVSNPSCAPNGSGRFFPVDPVIEKDRHASVKNTRPNAWGFYQMMVDGSSERTSDNEAGSATALGDVVDPHYPVKQDAMDPIPASAAGQNARQHCCKGSGEFPIQEMMRSGCGRGKPFEAEWNSFAKRDRIVVEVEETPAAPANK